MVTTASSAVMENLSGLLFDERIMVCSTCNSPLIVARDISTSRRPSVITRNSLPRRAQERPLGPWQPACGTRQRPRGTRATLPAWHLHLQERAGAGSGDRSRSRSHCNLQERGQPAAMDLRARGPPAAKAGAASLGSGPKAGLAQRLPGRQGRRGRWSLSAGGASSKNWSNASNGLVEGAGSGQQEARSRVAIGGGNRQRGPGGMRRGLLGSDMRVRRRGAKGRTNPRSTRRSRSSSGSTGAMTRRTGIA